jgi:hypothetical protein
MPNYFSTAKAESQSENSRGRRFLDRLGVIVPPMPPRCLRPQGRRSEVWARPMQEGGLNGNRAKDFLKKPKIRLDKSAPVLYNHIRPLERSAE